VGIAVCDAATESADQLLTTADHAVYRAKAHGRGTVEL
jgi:GGDEF domain-containing protein